MRVCKLRKCRETLRKTSGNNRYSRKFRITMRFNRLQIALRYHFDTEISRYEVVASGFYVVANL